MMAESWVALGCVSCTPREKYYIKLDGAPCPRFTHSGCQLVPEGWLAGEGTIALSAAWGLPSDTRRPQGRM